MKCVKNIKDNINVRESLIELKTVIQKDHTVIKDKELKQNLINLLNNEDPKVRKNSAILLGVYQDTAELLLDAYKKETTEYVKDAYLKGISMQECGRYIEELLQIQSSLMQLEDSSPKHIQAQLKILNPLILKYQTHKKKVIKLKHEPVDVVLTSLPYYQFVIFESVLNLKYKPVAQGVLVRTDSLYDLVNIRTYKDMLIPLHGASGLNIEIIDIEAGIKRCNLIEILDKLYDDHSVFYYRVVDGLREKNPALIKKVSEKLFETYPNRLLNVTEDYDIEIVLKEIRKDKVNMYIRLSHFKSRRFEYRKEVIPTSMHPYVAATLMNIAKPYMINNAKVLDPFVGSGTLLIERNIIKDTRFSMGLDIYGIGIEGAKKNANLAGLNLHFVHKDALRFVNTEMFDEVVTDMPTLAQMKDQRALNDLYDRFFERLKRWVRPEGYIFLYTSEISLVRKNLRIHEGYFELVEHYEIARGKNMFYFFIIQMK